MELSSLNIDSRVVDILRGEGMVELYPPQESAVTHALAGRNLVLAIPTASGKSLVAYLSLLKCVLNGGKALYIVPLRALASEKYEELKEFESLGIKVGISVGDYDTPGPSLEKFDVIIATSEKADSLLRHRVYWLKRLRIVVADEIHLINDRGRGPTLEIILAKLKQINPKAQIIALSATIKNSADLADWLGAKHVVSEWRPVTLKEGIYLDGEIGFRDNSKTLVENVGEDIESLVNDTISSNGQCLIFVNTRRSSEGLARRISNFLRKRLDDAERKELKDVSNDILDAQEEPTSMGRKLALSMRNGVAFHNAGLTNDQRKRVERSFRSGALKCIVATPTLAAGINLPARRVIIRDVKRFDANYGLVPIPVLEIKQMCGRAGRPKYDTEGEAVFIAKSEEERTELLENYILGEPERIYSKLGSEPALRTHILASIATNHVSSEEELFEFIGETFFAHQGDIWEIESTIEKVLQFLRDEEMIEGDELLKPTFFGKRVSDLYIDPLSAVVLRDALLGEKKAPKAFSFLHAVCSTVDMPNLYLRRSDYDWVEEKTDEVMPTLLLPVPEDDVGYEFFLSAVKTASLVEMWIEERSEDEVVKWFGVGPGDIRNKVEMAEWLVYSMKELSLIFNEEYRNQLSSLILRIRNGIKSELLELVSLKNVGRIRARALFNRSYSRLEDLKEADLESLSKIPGFGPRVARNILFQATGLPQYGPDVEPHTRIEGGEHDKNETKKERASQKKLGEFME